MTRNFALFKKAGWLLLLGLMTSCHNQLTDQKQAYVKVDTTKAVVSTFYNEIKGFGTIRSIKALDLEAKFDGIVHFENLKGRIKKGVVLYTMSGPEIDLKKENLEKALANAKTQSRYFKQYYAAKKVLAEKAYLSRIEFEKVTSDLQDAQNNLNKAQYALDYFLSMIRYKAPFDGYLDDLQVPQGEDAVVGQLLGTFQDDDHIKLVAPFYGNPNYLAAKKITVEIGGKTFEGKVIYIEKAVNPATGGHTLWVALQDPAHQLKSGSYVSFSFLTNKHKSVAVPEAAIIRQEDKFFVMGLINKHYRKISVIPGQKRNGLTEIKKGLKKGTVVLTKGAFEIFYGNLRKSMKVAD